jgi:Tol biopolymer transport system component
MKVAAACLGAVAAVAVASVVLAGGGGGPPGSSLSEKGQVFVVDRAGGTPRQLTDDDHDRMDLAWAPGGSRLASTFDDSRFDAGLEILSPKGRRLEEFPARGMSEAALAWSPDGRVIAFGSDYDNTRSGAIDARLVTLDLRSGARRAVAEMSVGQPSWAPDGRSLVYVRGDVVGEAPGDCTPPPDRPPDPSCHPTPGSPPEEVWQIRADGSGARRLVRKASSEFPAQLSHDGRRLLFARFREEPEPAASVWTARSAGGHEKRLAHGLLTPEVAWAPNGRDVVVLTAGRSRAYAFVLSPSGRRRKLPRAIASGPMAWSPDGGLIAWANGPRIEAVRPDGRRRRVLARLAGGVEIRELSWSPNGRRLAFTAAKPPPET